MNNERIDPCPPGFVLTWNPLLQQYLCTPEEGQAAGGATESSYAYWREVVIDPLCDYLDDPFPEEIDARYSYPRDIGG